MSRRAPFALSLTPLSIVAALTVAAVTLPARGQEPRPRQVIAVAALDSYADIKNQLTWLGPHVDNPTLAGLLESTLLFATQGKGLNGLDVRRPIGVLVTSDGADVAAHALLPVKDLDKLLASLEGVTGRVEKSQQRRRLSLPSGMDIDIVERDGWALVGQAGSQAPVEDPLKLLEPLAGDYSLVIKAFPSRLPEGIKALLQSAIRQMAESSAAEGRPVDANAVSAAIDAVGTLESLLVGVGIDDAKNRVFIENRTVAPTGRAPAASGPLTVSSAKTGDGGPAALRAVVSQELSTGDQQKVLALLDGAIPGVNADLAGRIVGGVVRAIAGAMVSSGALDAAATLDTSDAKSGPTLSAALRVKDGPALEKQIKELLGPGAGLPGAVDVRFDTGRAGDANLHTVGVDLGGVPGAEMIGRPLAFTLAVGPRYAYLLEGGDAKARLGELQAGSGKAITNAPQGLNVTVAMDEILSFAAARGAGAMAATAAERAASLLDTDAESAALSLAMTPIDRGVATRLSLGAGVVRALATLAGQAAAAGGGLPLPGGAPGR
ncbi:MAG: hypothetical protein KGQ61_08290 [Planctomycetes bacterium]|nr:hypothetical protein [Planctomycetota bacterium]